MTDRPQTDTLDRKAGLFVTATPIGNMGDISARALEVLGSVDVIACEDTRTTAKLLRRYGIETKTLAYHEHNAARVRPALLRRLREGGAVALVSDAGTPLISDPGYRLVREAAAEDIAVVPVPGPSALLAALVVAGLPTDSFYFRGFLPPKAGARATALKDCAAISSTLVFYESGRRLAATLAAMATALGPEREAAVCRELTKLHEEVRRDSLGGLAAYYAGGDGAPELRGEFVVVVGPPPAGATEADEGDIDAALREALSRLSLKEAVQAVTEMTGASRRVVYSRALALKDGGKAGR